jgi:Uma2 family endonuclease
MSVATLADPEELLRRPGDEIFEFVNGQPVGVERGAEAEFIATLILRILSDYVDDHDLGWVFNSKTSYRCFPHDPSLVRIPDTSFVPKGRLPGERVPKGFITVTPDLAVEVVSPHDEAEELENKIHDYFKAGVRLVWVLYPETKTALVRRIDHTAAAIPAEGSLSGEAVVPGFTCALAEVFV